MTQVANFDVASANAEEQQGFDIPALIGILRARWKTIAATMAVSLALAFGWFLMAQKTYNATTVMMLDQRRNTVADGNSVLSGLPTDTASIQNQIQIITSRRLAERVVEKLALDRDPEFSGSGGWLDLLGIRGANAATDGLRLGSRPGEQFDRSVDRALKRLDVQQLGASTTLTISVGSTNAEKSARITNAWADAYIEDQLNTKFEATAKAAEWYANRVRQLATQVQADEAAVQKYKAENGIVDTAGGPIVDQQTASVSTQLIAAKADLAQKSALYAQLASLKQAGRTGEATQVIASPIVAQLRIQESELTRQEAELSARYLPQHPRLVDLRAQVAAVRSKIAAEASRVVAGLANDVAIARANVVSLEASLRRLQSQFQVQGNASGKLTALQSIAASSKALYETVLSRLKEVQGQQGIATPDSRVVSRAVAPSSASPRFSTIFGVAIPASLALGLVLAFFAEGLDTSFRRVDQVERQLGLPVLSIVPELGDGISPQLAAIRQPASSFAESIRGLHLGLLSNDRIGAGGKIILITSSVVDEGKTVLAANLARMIAKTGRKVALVDADFRQPSLAKAMNLNAVFGGVTQALKGDMPLDRCMAADDQVPTLGIFACAEAPRDPSETLASSAMDNFLTSLKSKFDVVVIDSAPLLPVYDTWPLARIADATVLAVRSGRTSRDDATAAAKALRAMHAKNVSVALTRAAKDPRALYQDYTAASGDSAGQTQALQFSEYAKREGRG